MEQFKYTTNTDEMQAFHYHHFTLPLRKNLEALLRCRYQQLKKSKKTTYTLQHIAHILGMSKSAVSREIKRGTISLGFDASGEIFEYRFDVAQKRSIENRAKNYQTPKSVVYAHYISKLASFINKNCVSIETARYRLFVDQRIIEPISIPTLYKYVHQKKIYIKPKCLRHISTNKHKTHPLDGKAIQRGLNIALRPEYADLREEIGHWEGDTVYSSRGDRVCLLTLADRRSRLLIVVRIPDRTAKSITNALNEIEKKLGYETFKAMFKSITFDNGKEFSDVDGIEHSCLNPELIRTNAYYANPYHSWERGTNENTNGWIRFYFPKKTFFDSIPDSKIQLEANKINFSMRRVINNCSSYEYYLKNNPEMKHALNLLGFYNPFVTKSTK